jgi:hypothetical protein
MGRPRKKRYLLIIRELNAGGLPEAAAEDRSDPSKVNMGSGRFQKPLVYSGGPPGNRYLHKIVKRAELKKFALKSFQHLFCMKPFHIKLEQFNVLRTIPTIP